MLYTNVCSDWFSSKLKLKADMVHQAMPINLVHGRVNSMEARFTGMGPGLIYVAHSVH